MYKTYIIYSERLDRFYIGSTGDELVARLRRHNANHCGYTGKVDDWVIVYSCELESIQASRALEKKIKNRGARRFLTDNK